MSCDSCELNNISDIVWKRRVQYLFANMRGYPNECITNDAETTHELSQHWQALPLPYKEHTHTHAVTERKSRASMFSSHIVGVCVCVLCVHTLHI